MEIILVVQTLVQYTHSCAKVVDLEIPSQIGKECCMQLRVYSWKLLHFYKTILQCRVLIP